MQSASTLMTPRQVALVQESFDKIVPIREQAAALFYERLFDLDPSTRPLFRGDMKSQHQGNYWIGTYEILGDGLQGTGGCARNDQVHDIPRGRTARPQDLRGAGSTLTLARLGHAG